MIRSKTHAALSGVAIAIVASTAVQAAPFDISTATDLFAPSFRDLTDADLGNTTFFGWGPGSFDGGTNNELIDNPPITLGLGGINGALNQLGTADILAGSNDIYIGTNGRTDTLHLDIPSTGIVGPGGYTTIIIQGLTLQGSPAANTKVNYPVLGSINGIAPEFIIGVNADPVGQSIWWAKYEIPGNQADYDLDMTVTNIGGNQVPLTLTKLTVDTVYSTTGYASDTAVVPEPTSLGLLAFGGLAMLLLRRSRR